jgi:hypothetical protein
LPVTGIELTHVVSVFPAEQTSKLAGPNSVPEKEGRVVTVPCA